MAELSKTFQIIIALFPLFFVIVLLGIILRKGWNYLQKYSWFWLIGMIITGIMSIYAFFSSSIVGWRAISAFVAFGNCYSVYRLLKKKESKR